MPTGKSYSFPVAIGQMSIAIETVRYLAWDDRYNEVPLGLAHFKELMMFAFRDGR